MNRTYQQIYQIIRNIPRGKVATYGQIAALAGIPGSARQVGYALHSSRGENLPWYRVINARGEISVLPDPQVADLQHQLLTAEGILFDHRGRINLSRFQWQPSK